MLTARHGHGGKNLGSETHGKVHPYGTVWYGFLSSRGAVYSRPRVPDSLRYGMKTKSCVDNRVPVVIVSLTVVKVTTGKRFPPEGLTYFTALFGCAARSMEFIPACGHVFTEFNHHSIRISIQLAAGPRGSPCHDCLVA